MFYVGQISKYRYKNTFQSYLANKAKAMVKWSWIRTFGGINMYSNSKQADSSTDVIMKKYLIQMDVQCAMLVLSLSGHVCRDIRTNTTWSEAYVEHWFQEYFLRNIWTKRGTVPWQHRRWLLGRQVRRLLSFDGGCRVRCGCWCNCGCSMVSKCFVDVGILLHPWRRRLYHQYRYVVLIVKYPFRLLVFQIVTCNDKGYTVCYIET